MTNTLNQPGNRRRGPLNETVARNAKPRAVRGGVAARKLADGRGLFLLVSIAGGKSWWFRYRRPGDRKQYDLSLGRYPDVSLADARDRAHEARKLLACRPPIDPAKKRQADEAATSNTFKAVALLWFAKEKESSGWAEANSKVILERLRRDAFGEDTSTKRPSRATTAESRSRAQAFGDTPICSIATPDVLRILEPVVERGSAETARRLLMYIKQVFDFAKGRQIVTHNPAESLRGEFKRRQKKHFRAETDSPVNLGAMLRKIDRYRADNRTSLHVSSALRLLPLLFCRPGELRNMRWSEVDLDAAEWRFTLSKTKVPHVVPLSLQAVEILREVRAFRDATEDRCEFVFRGVRGKNQPISSNTLVNALYRAGVTESTAHGFRATARTMLDQELNVRPDFIEHQLGHTVHGALGRAYNRTSFLPERRQMMQTWANYLDSLKSDPSKVVSIHRGVAA